MHLINADSCYLSIIPFSNDLISYMYKIIYITFEHDFLQLCKYKEYKKYRDFMKLKLKIYCSLI